MPRSIEKGKNRIKAVNLPGVPGIYLRVVVPKEPPPPPPPKPEPPKPKQKPEPVREASMSRPRRNWWDL